MSEDSSGSGQLIIVCDDDPALRSMSQSILRRYGYRVLSAEDGRSTIELFRHNGSRVSAMVLDIDLPDLAAWQVLEGAKAFSPDLRVLVCSGSQPPAPLVESLKPQISAFLSKPYGVETLGMAMKYLLERTR